MSANYPFLKKLNNLFLITCLLFASCNTKKNVQLIVKNATIYTVDSNFSKANVLIVNEGKILDVGNYALLEKYSSDSVLDAKGLFIYPGFMDAHCHFTGYAMDSYKLNLYGTKSFEEMIKKVEDYAKINKRSWIEGRLWNENDWESKSFPNKDTLDKLFPNTPIFLMRIDGHAILCNQKALDISNINTFTKVARGKIEIKNGKLTGILIDEAVDLVKQHIPTLTQAEASKYFQSTEKECFSYGLTSLVDCGLEYDVVQWLKKSYEDKSLDIRVSAMLIDEPKNYETYLHQNPLQTEKFHIIGYKVFADGSLGSRGAYLLEDYHDQTNVRGYLLKPIDSIKAIAQKVYNSKYQLNIHAIGDASNRAVLNIYAEVLKGKNDRRWRIEHAQVVHPDDVHLFKDYSIIPSVQPTHATSDMSWAESRIGKERLSSAYAYQNLLQTNDWIPLGTDFPVESINPLYTFYSAVFRMNEKQEPKIGFQIENALTREQALRGMTSWAARSVFEEKQKGSLEIGKLADFVILPIDLMKAEAKTIYKTKVKATYTDGRCVYRQAN